MENGVGIEETVRELRQYFKTGKTKSVTWRKNQLKALLDLLHHNEDAMFKALHQDLGKHPVEAYRDEIGGVEKSANNALSSVEKWMAPKKCNVPLLFFPAKGELLSEPLGVVLIFSSWNFPIMVALDPLIGAISAGNVVVIKPSEQAPACSSFLANTIPRYLDSNAIKVIEGGADVCGQLLLQKWDKIFFTGSPRVANIVMSAAAKNLTPVTLELGGKCPAILDSLSNHSDLKTAVKRIVGAKWGSCGGQACIGIDYVLVEQKFSSVLIELSKSILRKFYGDNPVESKAISRIVNKQHFERLCNLLKDPLVAASIVHGGSVDEENLFVEPTILLDPPLDAQIMTEEIFGPLLPVITTNKIQESIEFINSRPKPLAIYAFTKDETLKRRILSETSSGSVTFNDTLIQFLCDTLPFGGVGQSGCGRYHGKYSFDTFSHEKAVMHGNLSIEIEPRYPPWSKFKLEFIRLAYRFNYFGLLLHMLGLKRYN
ncbi:aldehyde dehydrogenase family 3 member F1 [Gastrolobium bilobum]|uniref:aldehyde dehydrogenase family 3 member F1 n=1 Tax=Gastrolobium bilobum TaxID=150636 RepID=UPI002AB0DAD2|nr:aldehyde dehydrogenase family 3 member F1 [Gastrolobium bilobum]